MIDALVSLLSAFLALIFNVGSYASVFFSYTRFFSLLWKKSEEGRVLRNMYSATINSTSSRDYHPEHSCRNVFVLINSLVDQQT